MLVNANCVRDCGHFRFQTQGGDGYLVARPGGAEGSMARLNFVLIPPKEKNK
jgi:hypothetical protein